MSFLKTNANTAELYQNKVRAIKNAFKRAEKISNKRNAYDTRWATFRLLTTLLLLSVIAGNFSNWQNSQRGLAALGFLLFFVISGQIYKKYRNKTLNFRAYTEVLRLTEARIKRDFNYIKNNKSPWHDDILKEIPTNHLYTYDLDIHDQLFTLLNSCMSFEGSRRLFDLLMNGGSYTVDETVQKDRLKRLQRSEYLKINSKFLRHLECMRFNEITDSYNSNKNLNGTPTPETSINPSSTIPWIQTLFAFTSTAAWLLMLLPSIVGFIKNEITGEQLIQQLGIYAIIPIIGVAVFWNITQTAQSLVQKTVHLNKILTQMSSIQHAPLFEKMNCFDKNARKHLTQLSFWSSLVELRGNPIAWVTLHILLPFDAIVCLMLKWNLNKVLPQLQTWWHDVAEIDVCAAFARLADEDHSMNFIATVQQQSNNTFLNAVNLGHPLLAADIRVCNDVTLDRGNQVILLTGSNMAGKSTFLRTLGINSLLFNIGAPVCAKEFFAPILSVLCAIRVEDSLSEGTSYFYAEVKRLKNILDILKSNKMSLFLVDEIFRGTNNKERFLGSWYVIKALLNTQSYGIVSTHDLALTKLAEHEKSMQNMHFKEDVITDKLTFDYKLRSGPCPTTNALRIMRTEGLPIPTNPENSVPL